MKSPRPLLRLLLAGLSAVVLASSAHARNDLLLLPVDPALKKSHVKEILDGIPVRFGAGSAAQADILRHDAPAEGRGSVVGDDPRQRRVGAPSDEEVCLRAFEDAIGQLATQARTAGAAAIVGVVSDYRGKVRDDAQAYECHAGATGAYVTLRAQLARTLPATRVLPPASGFADIDDVGAVPLSDAGKDRYRHFLTLPSPRAFVVFEDGQWRFNWNDPEAMTKALDYCARAGKRCWLYAADDRVVWTADVAGRIGSSAQLQEASGDHRDGHQ